MAIKRAIAFLFAAAAIMAVGGRASATEESELSCQPLEVEINEPVTCYVYVRDSLQEPTTSFKIADFSIRVVGEEANAAPVVSQMTVTDDPTVVKFTVASPTGTNLRIDVVIKSSGIYIRNSGITVSALTWPATEMGALTCDVATLKLRSSTICTAPLFGPNGVPASVHTSDVYFSEDHAAGTFVFLSGVRSIVFNFTAPASLLAALDAFTIRVTLSAANRVFSTSIPMAYPAIAPSDRSLLRCTDTRAAVHTCFISAADSYGPVLFVGSKFTVTYERIVDGQWQDATGAVQSSFEAGTNAASSTLAFSAKVDNEIYTARVHVIAGGKDILNSPFIFQMGVPPAWSQLTFRSCTSMYVTPENTTTCTIDVATGVTADPSYISVTSRLGGKIVGPTYAADGNNSVFVFSYSAPNVASRIEEFLSVTTGGVNILSSPYRIIVYPEDISSEVIDTNGSRPGQIVIGLIFFGTILAVGSGVLFKRNRQAARVKEFRAIQLAQEDANRPMDVIVGRNLNPSSTTTSFGDRADVKLPDPPATAVATAGPPTADNDLAEETQKH